MDRNITRTTWLIAVVAIIGLSTQVDAEMVESIAFQSFEEEGGSWNFTPKPVRFDAASGTDVWTERDAVGTGSGAIIEPGSNDPGDASFWAMRDLNNDNGGQAGFLDLDFAAISTTGFTNLEVSFDYNVVGYDEGDDLAYEVFIDGVGQGEVTLVDGAGNFTTSGWQTETISVGNANSVALQLSARQNGAGDWAGWDNVSLIGKSASIPEPMTAATFAIGMGLVSRRRRRG